MAVLTLLRRALLVGLVLLPLIGLMALLAWGMAQTGGRPGGLLVNTRSGEVAVEERAAPDFTLELFDGDPLPLAELRGKVVMVDFWASWCPPCREEAPGVERVYREFQGRNVEFVGVDIWDDEGEARRYIQTFGLSYPNGPDERGLIAIEYGVTGIPEKYFIDRQGVVTRKFIGPMDTGTLRGLLEEMLAAP